MPQPGFSPVIVQIPATGRAPRPGSNSIVITVPPPSEKQLEAAQHQHTPRFGQGPQANLNQTLNTPQGLEPPKLGAGGLAFAGAALAESVVAFGPGPVGVALATVTIGGVTAQPIVLSNLPFVISPPLRKLLHFASSFFLPHKEPDPLAQTTGRVLGLPFQDIKDPNLARDFGQLRQLYGRLVTRAEMDIAKFQGDALKRAQSLFVDLLTFRRSVRSDSLLLGAVVFEGPDTTRDLGRLLAIQNHLEQLERQWELNAQSGFGGPLKGPAVMRGDKADP